MESDEVNIVSSTSSSFIPLAVMHSSGPCPERSDMFILILIGSH